TRSADGVNRNLFIDHVRLRWIRDEVYVVKNSWKTREGYEVPLICDATPNDSFPGAALGCTEYVNSKNRPVNTTGFDSLCREKAVGCEPLWDTHNTLADDDRIPGDDSKLAKAYHVWVASAVAGPTAATIQVGTVDYTCNVPKDLFGCYVGDKQSDTPVIIPPGVTLPVSTGVRVSGIASSTIIIPADTPSADPIFLTNTRDFQCQDRELGCTRLGLETQSLPRPDLPISYRHQEVFYLNNPDKYLGRGAERGTSCREEVVACNRFDSDRGVGFFKDPRLTGQSICAYKTGVDYNGAESSGWFMIGVGQCSQDRNALCRADSDCGEGNTCRNETIGNVPCYPNYRRLSGTTLLYDIWSNDSGTNYQGFVGSCPAAANSCTELLDPQDTSRNYPRGKAYYVLFGQDDFKAKLGACNGQVSLNEGCVLFNRTDEPIKKYDSRATYRSSETTNPKYGLVNPISSASNDANRIIKVDRDRACTEWLSCASSYVEQTKDGKYRRLCYEYKSCTKAEPESIDPGGVCTEKPGVNELSFGRFTEGVYIRRGTSWYDPEYSGYSLFDKYQINDLSYKNFDLKKLIDQETDPVKQRVLGNLQSQSYIVYDLASQAASCVPHGTETTKNWQACGQDSGGRCFGERCLYPTDGIFPTELAGVDKVAKILEFLGGDSCKVYPEKDSPYPTSVALPGSQQNVSKPRSANGSAATAGFISDATAAIRRIDYAEKRDLFGGANVCQPDSQNPTAMIDCSCAYTKVEYKNGPTDYWLRDATIPLGVCTSVTGNGKDGNPCTNDTDCTVGSVQGTCSFQSKKSTHVGLTGFCLEKDLSRPINGAANETLKEKQDYACLTWLPIDVSASNVDLANSYQEAGYQPVAAYDAADDGGHGQLYCTAVDAGGLYDREKFNNQTINSSDAFYVFNIFDTTALLQDYKCIGSVYNYDDSSILLSVNRSNLIPSPFKPYEYQYILCPSVLTVPRPHQFALLYQMMQAWAWKYLGHNALVIRAESDVRPEYVFAPNAGGKDAGLIDNFPSWYHALNVNGGFVYNSPYVNEEIGTINEREINKIFFVPIRWYGSIRGFTPPFLTDTLTLDFDRLKNTQSFSEPTSATLVHTHFNDLLDFPTRNAYGIGDIGFIYEVGADEQWVWKWTYKLNKTSANAATLFGSDPSNVDHRYVLVFFVGDINSDAGCVGTKCGESAYKVKKPQFIENNGDLSRPPDVLNKDPFQTICYTTDNHDLDVDVDSNGNPINSDNWFAISVDFDAQGTFVGYRSRWCNSYRGESEGSGTINDMDLEPTGINFAVIATMNNQCSQFAQVYDESGNGNVLLNGTNKAWTDRVWRNAGGSSPRVLFPYTGSPEAGIINRLTAHVPYGSTQLSGDRIQDQNDLLNFFFIDRNQDGVPYSCMDEIQPTGRQVDLNVPSIGTTQDFGQCSSLGATYHDASNNLSDVLSKTNTTTAKMALQTLFAKVYEAKRLRWDKDAYDTINSDQWGVPSTSTPDPLDVSSDHGGPTPLSPPKIYSLNPATCFGAEPDKIRCTAGEISNITVNQKNGTITDYNSDGVKEEDLNNTGFPDTMISVGLQTVNVKFFAFADDNRMPIRRVMVDWRDGSVANRNRWGFYKNHKPFCSSGDDASITVGMCVNEGGRGVPTVFTGMTCEKLSDCPISGLYIKCYGLNFPPDTVAAPEYSSARFGNAKRACTNQPFQFRHDYSCGQGDIDANKDIVTTTGAFANNVAGRDSIYNMDIYNQLHSVYGIQDDNTKVCVFRPRVQVLDNWGWCNSTDQNGVPTRDGEYNDGADNKKCDQGLLEMS
ncbi:MAG: hypothetical protein HY984_01570, partial [Candidatus Magasanikbacteria bacterium]|nr:hypothetical protein [Candidatus Magasanikbacteria bacterium]